MKVIVAKTAGFCKGVKDALEVTLEAIQQLKEGTSLCTYGPLIHNRQVLSMLEAKGIKEENDIQKCAGKNVVIRAHGIPPRERHTLHGLGATLLDATCKRVAKVHAVIKRHARRGYHTVIVGDADHAEVIGLMGYAEDRGVVINQPEEVDLLPKDWEKVLLVAQTTQNEEIFQEIQKRFSKQFPNGVVKNTICGSTHERQAEVRRLCSQVEAMVIVGGYHSGNTLRLAEVALECTTPTYHVETEADLNKQEMARYSIVGVSAGASTPNWIIRNVVHLLESIQPERSDIKLITKRIIELMAYGNVFVALGAALLSLAVQTLLAFPKSLAAASMAALYLFAMHSLNIYLDRDAIQLNDPERAAFYRRWRSVFTWGSIMAVVAALGIALTINFLTFLAMGILILLGLLYAVPVFVPSWSSHLSVLKIKDIPMSKTFSVPIAWAAVTAILPYLTRSWRDYDNMLYAFWIVFLMALVRTALLDLLAVQGDRLVGKETLVVLVGEKKTNRFLMQTLVVLAISLLLGPIAALSTSFAYLMLPAVGVYWIYLKMCSENRLTEDPLFEALIESVLIGTGILAVVWSLFGA